MSATYHYKRTSLLGIVGSTILKSYKVYNYWVLDDGLRLIVQINNSSLLVQSEIRELTIRNS